MKKIKLLLTAFMFVASVALCMGAGNRDNRTKNYTLDVHNDSQESGGFFVYQIDPNQNANDELSSLVWFSKTAHPNTRVLFNWDVAYEKGRVAPTYWIVFGNFEEGEVINVNNMSQVREVVFAANLYERSLTYIGNNEWSN